MITDIRRTRLDPQRHRFHNKAALWLTAATGVLMLCLSLLFGEETQNNNIAEARVLEDNGDDDYESYSCRYIYDQTPDPGDAQCRFARTCNEGAGVWAPFVFCSRFSTSKLFLAISPIMIVWMVILFRLLGSTAEDFFSPSLEMFSVKLGLPPRFAGVTLLALGNGAADVSATISAIVNDVDNGYQFSLGALTGAAMLVGGVVAGIVVLVADGVPCRGALIRDVTALLITICVVWVNLSAGTIGRASITLFLSMYGVFVLIVLVADIYHRAVVLPRIRAMQNQQQDGTEDAGSGASSGPLDAMARFITAISNYDNVCNRDTTVPNEHDEDDWGISSGTASAGQGQGQGSSLQDSDEPIILHGENGILSPEHHRRSAEEDLASQTETGVGNYELVQEDMEQVRVSNGSLGFSAVNWSAAFEDTKTEVVASIKEAWEDIAYNGDLNMAEKAMLIGEFPFTVLRKATVPIPCEGYYNRGLVALSMTLCPLWFAYYIWVGHEVNLLSKNYVMFYFAVWIISIISSLVVIRFAPGGEGTMPMVAATLIAFVGFVIAATWIDYIADHLVSLLDFVGIILHIPGTIMGLTILAWGNSMGDLSANMTMARKGLANMAMTACFAGPVFNILVGLGLGFSGLASKTGNADFAVSISSSILAGFIFVILNCVALLVTGLVWGKGRIEISYGYIALGLYTAYVAVSICLEVFL